MIKRILLLLVAACCLTMTTRADEGMWIPMLLKQLNESEMQANGLKLTAEDIYSINRSSLKDAVVHFGGGCTGEVISNQGLILTNHHCGYSQIQAHSSVENDYLKDGFWAKSLKDELANPGLFVTFIVRMDDVTDMVLKGTEDMNVVERTLAIQKNMKEIQDEAVKGTHYKAFIRPFFYGNEYYMFVTETFTDIRLVGAPPSSIGKFGYDEDNWMWPRHTGDFSVFRIYAGPDNKPADYSEANVPYKPKHFFPISMEGIEDGDFTMVYGFPGRTQQYLTSDAVDYVYHISNPAKIAMRKKSLSIIDAAMGSSDKIRIQYAAKQSRISNSYKKWIGENRGLKKLDAIEKKKAFEAEFTKLANQKPPYIEQYSKVLPQLKANYSGLEKYALARDYFIEVWYYGPEVIRFANGYKNLVENYASLEKNGKLSKELEKRMNSVKGYFKNYHMPTDKKVFVALMEMYYNNVDHSLLSETFVTYISSKYRGNFTALANDVYEKSVFVSKERMNAMLSNFSKSTPKKLEKDPAYVLMNELYNGYYGKVRSEYGRLNGEIDALMKDYVQGIRDMMPDKRYWSDANSTLRVAYGKVEGSVPRDGMQYTYLTTIDGVMEKYVPGDRDFDVSPKLIELWKKKDYGPYTQNGTVPVCFTASNHTTGGNSGSPVLNGEGHLIGINFDRSWESTMSDLMYDPERCRNIVVDIRYVLFVIDKFAGASHLVEEMKLVTAESRAWEEEKAAKAKVADLANAIKKSDRKDANLFYQRGVVLESMGLEKAAMDDYNSALKLNAKHTEALSARAGLYAQLKQYKEALADYNMLAKANATNELYFERGLVYADMGQYSSAIGDFSKAIQSDPSFHKAYYNRGVCYNLTGKSDLACKDLNVAKKIGRKEGWIYRTLCEE